MNIHLTEENERFLRQGCGCYRKGDFSKLVNLAIDRLREERNKAQAGPITSWDEAESRYIARHGREKGLAILEADRKDVIRQIEQHKKKAQEGKKE